MYIRRSCTSLSNKCLIKCLYVKLCICTHTHTNTPPPPTHTHTHTYTDGQVTSVSIHVLYIMTDSMIVMIALMLIKVHSMTCYI